MPKNPDPILANAKSTGRKAMLGSLVARMGPFFIAALLIGSAQAQPRIPQGLWKGLLAEDVAGGYRGMYAVACCVRNRLNAGLDHGLAGMRRKNLDAWIAREREYALKKKGVDLEFMAKDILRKVFFENGPDTTGGATHFEEIQRYGIPKWTRGMVRTVRIGVHTFYKKRREA